jgi:hypothetical protein
MISDTNEQRSQEIIVDIEEMMRNEPEQEANLRKWLLQYALPFTPAAKRQGGKKAHTWCSRRDNNEKAGRT